MRARLNYVTGSLTWGDEAWYCKDDWDNQAFAVMEKLNLSNAAQTFRLEYRSESGTLCYIQHARILALRLDAFDNSYFASNHSPQNTTQATDQDFLTLTATPLALSHAIVAVGSYNTVSTSVSAYLTSMSSGTAAPWRSGCARRRTPPPTWTPAWRAGDARHRLAHLEVASAGGDRRHHRQRRQPRHRRAATGGDAGDAPPLES
jgi:hypothetical protein